MKITINIGMLSFQIIRVAVEQIMTRTFAFKNLYQVVILSIYWLSMGITFARASSYFQVNLVNNSHIAEDSQVNIFIKGTDPLTNSDCVMRIDKNGYGFCDLVGDMLLAGASVSSRYSYKLSDLPARSKNEHMVYLPPIASGRIYFSIGYPMDFYIDRFTKKILDPDGFKVRDTNYFTLYDKVEFTFNQNGVWINPTAVDFFSLPISILQEGSTSDVKRAGLSESRANIIAHVQHIFSRDDKSENKIWNKLFLKYDDHSLLRIVVPGKAMISNIPNTDPFAADYLTSYIDYVWEYYNAKTYPEHKIVIDCSELKSVVSLDNYIFIGQTVSDHLVFVNQTGTYKVDDISKPESISFFAGAVGSFNAENNTPKAIIIRQITSAFEVGLLPVMPLEGNAFAWNGYLDKNYFHQMNKRFYQDNPLIPSSKINSLAYDLYSKALHGFPEDPIYTFAYDDALGQDGTLYDQFASPATITIQDMSGTHIPNPYTDSLKYDVTIYIGNNSIVMYEGQRLDSNKATVLQNVSMPLRINFNNKEAIIYLKHPLIRPYFEGADGIIIKKLDATTATIIFPGLS